MPEPLSTKLVRAKFNPYETNGKHASWQHRTRPEGWHPFPQDAERIAQGAKLTLLSE